MLGEELPFVSRHHRDCSAIEGHDEHGEHLVWKWKGTCLSIQPSSDLQKDLAENPTKVTGRYLKDWLKHAIKKTRGGQHSSDYSPDLNEDHSLIYLGLAFDEEGNVIGYYVGKTTNGIARVGSHLYHEKKAKKRPGQANLHYQVFSKAHETAYIGLMWLKVPTGPKAALHLALLEALVQINLGSCCLFQVLERLTILRIGPVLHTHKSGLSMLTL